MTFGNKVVQKIHCKPRIFIDLNALLLISIHIEIQWIDKLSRFVMPRGRIVNRLGNSGI